MNDQMGSRTSPSLVLLPGLDGTGVLFSPLLSFLPPALSRQVVAYPFDTRSAYCPVRVSMRTRSPWLMNRGTEIS